MQWRRLGLDEHYLDPALYDGEYQGRSRDVAWYRSRVAGAGRVLDLACGSGRLSLPLAQVATEVIGLDKHPLMVARLNAEAQRLLLAERVQARVGDMRWASHLGLGCFDRVILGFNALLHLHTHQSLLTLLQRSTALVAPDGALLFDVLIPDPAWWAEGDWREEEHRMADPHGGVMRTWETGHHEPLAQTLVIQRHYVRGDGRYQVLTSRLRMYGPQEILSILALAGWQVTRCVGDFSGRPLSDHSPSLIVEARVNGVKPFAS